MNSRKNILIILLIILNIIILIIGIYIYSKYISRISGTGNIIMAEWNFKVNNSSTQIETIDLSDTITNNIDGNASEGKIVPGTEGEINLVLDASETEVAIIYKIQVNNFINKPTNLEFYLDSDFTIPIELEDGTINIYGYIPLEQTELIRTIYWKWPYQIGETEQEREQNDSIDSQDSGKQVICSINVIGEQAQERLVDEVEIGDYVNYDASSGIAATYTTDESLTGSSEISTFSSSDEMAWRVLSKNTQTGEVILVSADPIAETLTLSGTLGYINGEIVLNGIGAVYGHGNGAIEGRSITLEDIEQYSSYDKTTYENANTSTGYYGGTVIYTSGTFINEDGTQVTASNDNPITITQTYYGYTAQSYFENIIAYNMLFKNSNDITVDKPTYWVASRCLSLISDSCYFDINYVNLGTITARTLYSSLNLINTINISVLPVVSLQPNICTTGKNENGAWQLLTIE